MESDTKIRIARSLPWLCLAVVFLSFGPMIAAGFAGNTGTVKLFFIVVVLASVTGIASAIMAHYWREEKKLTDVPKVVEIQTLQAYGQQLRDPNQDHPTEEK